MKKPYLLLGSALVLWGAATGNLLIGCIAAVVLEIGNFIKTKLEFSEESYIRISDLTSIIFVAAIVLLFFNYEAFEVLPLFAKWLPMVYFLLVFTQVYGASDKITIGTKIGKRKYTHKPMNIIYPYLFLTLFSATTANIREPYFFFGIFGVTALGFFYMKNRRYKWYILALSILLFSIAAYIGQMAAVNWYANMRNLVRYGNVSPVWERFIRERMGNIPFEGVTSMGDVGELKLSGKIIVRVEILPDANGSYRNIYYMRDGTYDIFAPPNWSKKDREYSIGDLDENDNWVLNSQTVSGSGFRIKVNQKLNGRKGLIPLPYGSYKIERLGGTLETDRYGTVRISEAARSVEYKVWIDYPSRISKEIANADRMVLDIEKKVVEEKVKELGLDKMAPNEAVAALSAYFRENFRYTLNLERRRHKSYLHEFLNERKAGHCEYFATATVLLLRGAGIPARYVTGYVLNEKSPNNPNMYIIRERHGHAWAEAYIDNKWIIIDNTPSVWLNEDEKKAGRFEKLSDFFENLSFSITTAFNNRSEAANRIITIVVIGLLFILAARIYMAQSVRRKSKNQSALTKEKIFKITENDFNLIMKELGKLRIPRMKHETAAEWVDRIKIVLKNKGATKKYSLIENGLNDIIARYYKVRYHPDTAEKEELIALNTEINKWLDSWKGKK